jgi:hypothetical protein
MRLEHLVEKDLPADTILKEIGVPKDEREVILEFLPLIPVALWAGGAAWTAYDTYQAKKALDAGEITQAQFAARVGTDVAIGVAGGVLGKIAGKGFKVGKEIYKTKKAARAAQKKTADIPTPKDAAIPPTGINTVANATTTTTKKTVQTAKPGDTIKTTKGEFLAGVDGKATTTRIGAPNAAEIKKQILSVVNQAPSSSATIVTKTELVPGANAAAKVADKVVDKVKDVAPKLAKKVVDKVKDTGTTAVNKVKDLAKKAAPVSKDISAPAAALSTKAAVKQTTKKLTKTQQNALSSMGKNTSNAVNKATKTKLTKAQRDALSSMGKNLDGAVGSLAAKSGKKVVKQKLTKAQQNALSKMPTPVTSVAAKAGSKTAAKKITNKMDADDIRVKKTKGSTKGSTTGKTASRTSRLLRALRGGNKGDFYQTDLTGVIKRHMRNG